MQLFKMFFLNKFIYKIFLTILLISNILYANDILKSQPQIIFELDKLDELEVSNEFNKAVLLFNKQRYKEAYDIFEKTKVVYEIPSLLNMAIILLKDNKKEEAITLFSEIYSKKSNLLNEPYAFIASCYYLFTLTSDDKYMIDLVTIFQNSDKLKNQSEIILNIKDIILEELANRYLMVKDYDNALGALNAMSYSLDLKKALVYIKQNNLLRADIILKKLIDTQKDEDRLDEIYWFSVFVNLKLNKLDVVKEILEKINKRGSDYKVHINLPFEIYFNKDLYSSSDYLKSILKFDEERKLDYLYYFAPFVFSDSKELMYDTVKGMVSKDKSSLESLEAMFNYNINFIKAIRNDPFVRIDQLKNELNENSKAYNYYNLALAFAQIKDLSNAYKYFEKAYKLSPGNKLYAVMYLITSNKVSKSMDDKQKELIKERIKSSDGLYNYFAKELYSIYVDISFENKEEPYLQTTLFFKALDFLKKLENNEYVAEHPLLIDWEKDSFIYLLKLVQQTKNEDDYKYFSRMQDTIPLKYNNNFLNSSLITSLYYIDILKALGIFSRADFYIPKESSPLYLLTDAYSSLYLGKANESINILNRLKNEYNIENRFTMYLLVASYLEAKRREEASIQITLIKAFYNDTDTDFLTAIQLIQTLNINAAIQFLNKAYNNQFISFDIIGFDEFMLSL
ncbi:tetratricopeptide repeat protein [Aliarcobacter skirrowii]|uniref:Tetratricopeptide repeat protein n=3 Tax=Aliarcobacter skirrowii TaxID=28200 RepID=A0A2U2C206_9BACT|nr:tetratricopeptide repeat protein [Aliarcobacter skirrowii]PWE22319.1 tetratricopeptide repeat protein [Aliarcobacter skirrowii]RJO56027.1 tetratricopeptide repeat protein [Aliarcobacter skirrowii]RJO57975.1 tetratricopeptide repeat protein [Aliarcobacter skirrowii]RXJ80631.1 tetratricopeptide repeat protein [Aliarcobacter skirrowii]